MSKPKDEPQVKITVKRGKNVVHEETVPWSRVATEEVRWTTGFLGSRNRFSAKRVN